MLSTFVGEQLKKFLQYSNKIKIQNIYSTNNPTVQSQILFTAYSFRPKEKGIEVQI